ncbi:ATP synthase F1 subunit delta [bacterium]|nr:ATP synthase F1 subunit delta [bacterium]
MEKVDIKKIKPAKNYSNALFETAKELGRNEKVLNELEYIVDLISKNDHLKEFLNNPVISKDDKKSVLSQVFDGILSDITTDFLLLLNDNSRLDLLEAVLVQYTKKMDEELNIERPNVISAVELSDDYKNTIIQKLESKLNSKVLPRFEVEPSIIGGLIIEVKDKTIDFSLNTKFKNMSKQLIKG